jgi:hypothetical protein
MLIKKQSSPYQFIVSYLLMRGEQDKQSKKLGKDLITINTFHNPAN